MRIRIPFLFLIFLSCTAKEQEGNLGKQIAAQKNTIDSLQNIIQGSGNKSEAVKTEADSAEPVSINLNGKIETSEINDLELAEVLSIADADTAIGTDDFEIRAYLVCNGPPDLNIDGCNCSHYAYVAMHTYDMPFEYSLSKVGPFFMPKFGGWGGAKNQPELTIQHQVKGKPVTTIIKAAAFGKVTFRNSY